MKGALFRLNFFSQDGACMLRMTGGDEPVEIETGFDWDDIRPLRARIAAELYKARTLLGPQGTECDLPSARQCLEAINDAGRTALQNLFGARLPAVRQYLEAGAYPDWNGVAPGLGWPSIEVRTPKGRSLPVEIMPFAHQGVLGPIDSEEDLRRAVRRFPGFSFVIRRVNTAPIAPDNALKGAPRVPLKMFYHAQLAGARDEASFIEREFDLDGPWPGGKRVPYDAARGIRSIVDCHLDLRGGAKPVIDQVHHFSCHCLRAASAPPRSIIELCAEAGTPFWIDRFELEGAFEAASACDRPLGFLNACETNSPASDDYSTWAYSLANAGYRGVIGTEVAAPDLFAAAFSKEFYGALLARQTVGQALQTAKWNLLERWNNPLGLLYTYLGNPDLQIQ